MPEKHGEDQRGTHDDEVKREAGSPVASDEVAGDVDARRLERSANRLGRGSSRPPLDPGTGIPDRDQGR